MVPRTRRRLLHGATALLVGLAGCQDASSGTSSSNDLREAENVETDPDHYALRNPENATVAWVASSETDDGPPTPRRTGAVTDREHGLVASPETASRLRFADVDGAEGARAFVDGTDFDRETLLLDTRRVDECYRLELCAVTWSTTSYHTYYGRTYRPADVSCRVDANDRATRLIRIPDALDPEQITSAGTGTSSGSCHKFRRQFQREATERTTADSESPDAATAEAGPEEEG